MDFEFDKDLEDLFKKLSRENRKQILDYLKKQAEIEKQKLQSISPFNQHSKKDHLKDKWKVNSQESGSTVINTKPLKSESKGHLAYLLNNYSKSPNYQWFDKWWGYEINSLRHKLVKDIDEIIKKIIK